MAYAVHITRAEHWSDNAAARIDPQEWLAVVAADPELRLEPENGDCFAVWDGPSAPPGGGWFEWADGNVFTGSPDRAILAKMFDLAALLGAKVQGEQGEVYTSPAQWTED